MPVALMACYENLIGFFSPWLAVDPAAKTSRYCFKSVRVGCVQSSYTLKLFINVCMRNNISVIEISFSKN